MNQRGFIAFIIIAALIGVGVLIFVRSNDSLPGDRLYKIKSLREEIYVSTNSLAYENLINANLTLANERVREISRLVESSPNEELIRSTLLRLGDHQRKALDYTIRIKMRGSFIPEYFEKVETTIKEHQKILSELYYYIPQNLYPDLDNALDITEDILKQIDANR